MSNERCPKCNEEYAVGDWPFCPHGKFVAEHLAVVDDTIPGGMVVENMGPTPLRFNSKSEWRAEMKRRGLVNKVEHVGVPGSDRSPHTSRWV